jgi:hypothetical protein
MALILDLNLLLSLVLADRVWYGLLPPDRLDNPTLKIMGFYTAVGRFTLILSLRIPS